MARDLSLVGLRALYSAAVIGQVSSPPVRVRKEVRTQEIARLSVRAVSLAAQLEGSQSPSSFGECPDRM
jgi:hypothetical protein